MAYDEALAGRVRSILSSRNGVGERSLFGGLTFSINGNMVASVNSRGLTLSVGKENYEKALGMSGVKKVMMGEKPMPNVVMAEDPSNISNEDLNIWVNMAADAAAAKPPKVK
ncbi:hypothetical protein IH575_01315 [Candidatus Dojkabacteria bacterium]|nr:hypothetical protein [Candidatus Dojkabacteria bacterium]